MGNRRMGLARLEALLEAVDRDLNLANTTLTSPAISGATKLGLASETVAAGNGSGSATALSLVLPVSFITTATNSSHVSLANGTEAGQVKFIVHKTRSNAVDLVITPASFAAGSNITSNLGSRSVGLMWDGSNWQVIAGEITGTAEMVIA
jgi:hypothetical protein